MDGISFKTLSLNMGADPEPEAKKRISGKEMLPADPRYSRYRVVNGDPELRYPRIVCPDLRMPVITVEGDVLICCVDSERRAAVGNIFESGSFEKVWFSDRYRRMRKKSLGKNIEICRMCNFGLDGCRRVTFGEQGTGRDR